MPLFLALAERIAPLLLLIALGFVAGRFLRVDRESIARLLIYLVAPYVFFASLVNLEWKPQYALGPLIVFGLCTLVALSARAATQKKFGDLEAGLIGFASGNANSGYFGLPVALALYGETSIGLLVFLIMGFNIYENTVGFFILAQGKYGPRDAMKKLVRLPAIYAFVAAGVAKLCGMKVTGVWLDWSQYFRGAYSMLGMMLIGLGLSQVRRFRWDLKLNGALFVGKFVAWPAAALLVMALAGPFVPPECKPLLFLLSACPLAANTVVFASFLELEVERVSSAVLISTLFAVLWIPFLLSQVHF